MPREEGEEEKVSEPTLDLKGYTLAVATVIAKLTRTVEKYNALDDKPTRAEQTKDRDEIAETARQAFYTFARSR